MIDFKKNWIKILVFLILLSGSIALLFLQIDRAQTASKLESSLISAIQFMLSIGFTWLLSMVVFENNQKEKQKKFAIAAFRRIKEIERNILRTQDSVRECLSSGEDPSLCLKVVQANLVNVKDTISSSIYDWADIIEDEIEIAGQIKKLEQKQAINSDVKLTSQSEQENVDQQIDALSKRLPPSLRQAVKQEESQEEMIHKGVVHLGKEMITNGCLDLHAFWETKDSFSGNLDTISINDVVYVGRGITENRSHPVLVYDKAGNSIGIVTNRCGEIALNYECFAKAMDIVFGRKLSPTKFGDKPVAAKVMSIDDFDPRLKRRYFTVVIQRNISDDVLYGYPELAEHSQRVKKA